MKFTDETEGFENLIAIEGGGVEFFRKNFFIKQSTLWAFGNLCRLGRTLTFPHGPAAITITLWGQLLLPPLLVTASGSGGRCLP